MASITRHENGRKTIQFVDPEGSRKSVRLGQVSDSRAAEIKSHVEELLFALGSDERPKRRTQKWIADVRDRSPRLYDRLAATGLVSRREKAELEAFFDQYAKTRTDVKESTKTKWRQTRKKLLEFFGPTKKITEITPGDADEWRLAVAEQVDSENTVRKHVAVAKTFFNAAVRKQLIDQNPFADLKATIQANKERFVFVDHGTTNRVITACPDVQWRLIFALSRFGGLRCPSEHLSLRWGDVNWEAGRVTITSPKTERYPNGKSRVIPLFVELRPFFEEAFDLAEPGTEYVITRYRQTNANLRTQLLRIMKKAGVKAWPNLFHNLRKSRQTELEDSFPSHVVCEWLGNSERVALKHYLHVTDAHYERAISGECSALQKAVQQSAASSGNAPQASKATSEKPAVLPEFAAQDDCMPSAPVAEAGLEPARG